MNRLEKKCFAFSVGLHGLLAVILLGSAAFRNRTEETETPILSIIPANIIDGATSGGGEPAPAMRATPAPTPAPAQAQPQPAAAKPEVKPVAVRPQPQPQMAQPEPVRHQNRAKEEPDDDVRPVVTSENPVSRKSKPRHQHEIHPTFATTSPTTSRTKVKADTTADNSEETAKSAARTEARRMSALENSLEHLASGVQSSGAARTVVDVPGISGGGEVFAGYRDVVRSYYYRAWIQPDNGSDKSALPEAKIVVARDGTIISAELVTPSGERLLDKSVERTLLLVTKLPPFPTASHDDQRTFRIQFSLELKQATG